MKTERALQPSAKASPVASYLSAIRAIVWKDLAAELRGSNVLVNMLDPGWLRTDLGGPQGEHAVESVLPGALVPALLEDYGPSGRLFAAQDFKYLQAAGGTTGE